MRQPWDGRRRHHGEGLGGLLAYPTKCGPSAKPGHRGKSHYIFTALQSHVLDPPSTSTSKAGCASRIGIPTHASAKLAGAANTRHSARTKSPCTALHYGLVLSSQVAARAPYLTVLLGADNEMFMKVPIYKGSIARVFTNLLTTDGWNATLHTPY